MDAAPPDSDVKRVHDETRHAPLEKLVIASGKVAGWTTNKGGDVDGFRVGESNLIHFLPHHGEQVSSWLKIEDKVTVFATLKSRPDGTEVMEAVILQRGDEAMHVPGPKVPMPFDSQAHSKKTEPQEELMSARGKVTELHENREGNVDGFKIDGKTEVKFPPHLSKSILASVQVGSEVVVDGRRHETPQEEIHLHADRVSSRDVVIEIDRPQPKKVDENPVHGKKGPGGAKGPRGNVDRDEESHGKPAHMQIVDELRKIRELLEEQGAR